MPRLRFAGQITGCEGYVESAAIGLLAGRFAAAERRGEPIAPPPPTTAHGALLAHITGGHIETIDAGPRSFQPMNVNFGLFPPLAQAARKRPRRQHGCAARQRPARKKRAICARALADLDRWIGGAPRRRGIDVRTARKSGADCAPRATAAIAAATAATRPG